MKYNPITKVYKKKGKSESRRTLPFGEVANIQKEGTCVRFMINDEKKIKEFWHWYKRKRRKRK